MNIGDKIKELRINNGLTQEQLAEKLFVTRNAIFKWETNKGLPNVESLKMLSEVFNVSIDDLISDEEFSFLTISQKKTTEFNKNLIYSIILFIGFALIGTIIPYFSFMYDSSSKNIVFYLILPASYFLLGVITVLISAKWPNVLLSSSLALTPIYIFFDSVIKNVSLNLWGVFYLFLFLVAYFTISIIAKVSIKSTNIKKLKKLFSITSISISLIYLIHTLIEAIILYNCVECSAPWYTAIILNTLFYIIPLTVSYSLFFYFKNSQASYSES